MRELCRIIMVTGIMCFVLTGCDEDGSSPTGPGGDVNKTVTIECRLIGPYGISNAESDAKVGIRLFNTQLDTSFYHYPSFPYIIAEIAGIDVKTQEYPEFA